MRRPRDEADEMRCVRLAALALLLAFASAPAALCQEGPKDEGDDQPPQTVFDHPDDAPWYVGGQVNVIAQAHGRFRAPYSGENSLRPDPEHATSRVLTLFAGTRLGASTEVLVNVESSGGTGLSQTLGVAGFPNYDIVRNPTLGSRPYLARLVLHHAFALGPDSTPAERSERALLPRVATRRLDVRVGKFSTVDYFDTNAGSGDTGSEFINWTVGNDGAYDNAADTRGYTVGAVTEFVAGAWTLRFGEMLMPKVANGIDLQWNLRRARSHNLELEIRKPVVRGRHGAVRVLAFLNTARMGDYREAIDAFLAGTNARPDIVATRREGRRKHGAGLNVEQEIADGIMVFGRAGWNDGKTESFVFTEVDRAGLAGLDVAGGRWRRRADKAGVALSVNALSAPHRRYLALGGHGFLIGDGRLDYGRERIVEAYYNVAIVRGVSAAFDLQHISNPAYNRDRGPVLIPAVRVHLAF